MMTHTFVADNVDRMLFQVLEDTLRAEPWRAARPIVVVNDATGALSQWVLDRGLDARFVQDSAALAALQQPLTGRLATLPSPEIFAAAATVIYRLPRPLEALAEFGWQVARWAAPDVMLLAGQLQRHLNFSMNAELEKVFEQVSASRGRFKARALRAQGPKALHGQSPPRFPRKNIVEVAGSPVQLRAHGLTFGAARLDPGTKLLLDTLLEATAEAFTDTATVVDLGCGNGTIAAVLAQRVSTGRLIATDDSASAVASTRATLHANGVADVDVMHQSGLETLADETVDVIVLNPPFHKGTRLTSDIAMYLFDEAARVLKPGGVLVTVFNTARHYRPHLTTRVGPTWQLARDQRFVVTQSQKGSAYV